MVEQLAGAHDQVAAQGVRSLALEVGDELLVMATDPEATIDLAAWAADEGHPLEEHRREGWTEFVLRKGQGASASRP